MQALVVPFYLEIYIQTNIDPTVIVDLVYISYLR